MPATAATARAAQPRGALARALCGGSLLEFSDRAAACVAKVPIPLVLVALQDVLYMEALRIAWPRFGRKLTRVLHWTYFVALTLVTFLKLLIVLTLFYASAPVVDPKTSSGATFCQILDRLWMLLAAVLPIVLAALERRSAPGLYFVVTAAGAQPDDPEGK